MIAPLSASEFKAAVRNALGYLESDYDFAEQLTLENPNEKRVRYKSSFALITVEEIFDDYGAQVVVESLEQADSTIGPVLLWAIIEVRDPLLNEELSADAGQIEAVQFYGRVLRESATDVLRGDLSVLRPAARFFFSLPPTRIR